MSGLSEGQLIAIFVGALLAGILGGGGISALLRLALSEKLRDTFASKESVDKNEARLAGLESVLSMTRTRADEAFNAADRLSLVLTQHAENMAQQVVRPLEKISDRMDALAEAQRTLAENQRVQALVLENFEDRLGGIPARRSRP